MGDESLCDVYTFMQYLLIIFIAILDAKPTHIMENKGMFWTLAPSNRQMALVFLGWKQKHDPAFAQMCQV